MGRPLGSEVDAALLVAAFLWALSNCLLKALCLHLTSFSAAIVEDALAEDLFLVECVLDFDLLFPLGGGGDLDRLAGEQL